jgi:spore coat protein U-like protein
MSGSKFPVVRLKGVFFPFWHKNCFFDIKMKRSVKMRSFSAAVVLAAAIFMTGVHASACTVSVSPVNFGIYESNQSSPLPGLGSVTLNCQSGTTFEIGIDNGLSYQTPYRRMNSAGHYLLYQFYQENGYNIVWGNSPGSDTVLGIATGSNQRFMVYGRIPGNQLVPEGTYNDRVTVTVYY